MKKLTAAFTLLASLAFAGSALADSNVHTRDRRAPIQHAPAPVVHQPAAIQLPAPAAVRAAWMNARWDTLAVKATPQRRGVFQVALPARGSYDQLRLISSNPNLDILGVELTYARGRSSLIRPDSDGLVDIDLGRGKVKSVTVRYVNRGPARGATIKVLAKDDDQRQGPPARPGRPGRR